MIAFVALAALAQQPLQPTGKWTVSYNDNDCTAQRSFGDAAKPVVFGFKPAPTNISGDLVLVLPGRGASGVRRGKGKVTLAPGGERFDMQWASGPLAGDRHGFRLGVDKPFWDALPKAASITFELGTAGPVAASLGSMAAPLKALAACGDDLLRQWGADPAAVIRDPDLETLARLFAPNIYPPEAQRKGEQGRVGSLTSFDRTGKAAECRLVILSGSKSLDATTCAVMKRQMRIPADAAAPEKRWLYVPVRWMLP